MCCNILFGIMYFFELELTKTETLEYVLNLTLFHKLI